MAEVKSATVRAFWLRVRDKISLEKFLIGFSDGYTHKGIIVNSIDTVYPFDIAGIRFSLKIYNSLNQRFEVNTAKWQLSVTRDPNREVEAMLNGIYRLDDLNHERNFNFDLTGSEKDFYHDSTLMMMFYD